MTMAQRLTCIGIVSAGSILTLAGAIGCGGGGSGGSGGGGGMTASSSVSSTAQSSSVSSSSTSASSSSSSSSSSGMMAVCGDGKVQMGEACDDGNTADGDGCSKACVKECTSLHFDGTDFATAASPSTLDVKSVTLAGWYKVAAGAPLGFIAAKRGNTPGGHFTYDLGVSAGAGLQARLQTNVNLAFLDLSAPAAVPDGKWHHAAVTYDAATGNGEMFYDGKSVATGTKGTGLVSADPTQPFTVGALTLNGAITAPLTGDIADVVVYNVPLTSAQVAGLFQGKYPSAGLIAFYLTAEGKGTTSADASGSGHALTFPGAGWSPDGPFCVP